jgi:hypothetical protein
MPNALARYLSATGRTKYSLAKAAGIPWKTVHRLAKGQHTPGHRIAEAISGATEGVVSVAELLAIGPTVATKNDGASPDHAESAA